MDSLQSFLPYKILKEGGRGEITEKKSRFIATLTPVNDGEEAVDFIEAMKKKYWDARHNCSAFVVGDKAQLTRCSDDGEPPGTAGKPMLEVLLSTEVRNAAVVVTRYFGGTLLGTGGLVRAYTQAAQAGLDACRIVTMEYGVELDITADYSGIGKILYILGQMGLEAKASEYTDIVRLNVLVPSKQSSRLRNEITEATAGKTRIAVKERYYFEHS